MERNTNLPPEHIEVIKKQYSFGMIRHLCEEIERLRAENSELNVELITAHAELFRHTYEEVPSPDGRRTWHMAPAGGTYIKT